MADLDLDVLAGRTKTVKINDKILVVKAPQLDALISVLKASQDLQGLEGASQEQIIQGFNQLVDSIEMCVTGIKQENPNLDQLMALIQLIIELATPSDIQELTKNGIKMDVEEVKKNQI